ncbi:MAG: extracellular solute-binding protein [Stomatobaculum sp.]|nr:extracellular solute-binding protein [Stomatobaculum sp.]
MQEENKKESIPEKRDENKSRSRKKAAAKGFFGDLSPAVRGYGLSLLLVVVCVGLLAWCGKQGGGQETSSGAAESSTVEPVPESSTQEKTTEASSAEETTAPPETAPAIPPELLEEAQKEGRLTVYGSGSESYLAAAAAYFEELYGIRVSYSRLPNSEVYTRIKSSHGDPPADVWFEAAWDPVTEAASEDLLEGDWFGINYDPYCLLVNSEVLQSNQALTPESWQDLTGEQYRLMLSMPDPNITGAGRRLIIALQQLFGKEQGLDMLRAIHRNMETYGARAAEPAELAALGKCGIAVCLFSDAVSQLRNGNEYLIPVIPEEGTPYERNAAAVFRGASHPKAAELWMLFVQSAECQDLAARCKAYQIPEAEDALPLPEIREFSLKADNIMEFDFEDAKENNTAYVNDFYAALIR